MNVKHLFFLIFFAIFANIIKAEIDLKKYQELSVDTVKAMPEEYKNKRIWFETVFVRYETTFLPYMEKSGYRPGKYYYLQVKPSNFPVMAEKNDLMNAIIPSLKAGSKVKLYGKVKKFSSSPEMGVFPVFHLELDNIEVIEIGNGKISEEDKKDALTPRQKDIIKRKLHDK